MTGASNRPRGGNGARLVGVLMLAVAVVISAVFLLAPARAAPSPGPIAPASGTSEQWAFGGHVALSYSCQNANCFNDSNFSGSYSLNYYIEWVVIYTRTNVSSTQTMIEGQAALNASASLALSENVNGTTESLGASLSGMETSAGFTNVTTGSVSLTSSANATTWTSPALAITNASSDKAFNFSGSYSIKTTNASGSANFDFGGHETSFISFAPSLGIVPTDPQPGDSWNATAPFQAGGSWVSGYSISVQGISGASESNWSSHSVTGTGTLGVNGTDLGAVTLYDNYTSPPTEVTAQIVYLDFGTGAFTLSDGWLMVPSGLYADLFSGLSSTTGASTSSSSNETTYYQTGSGFIGAGLAGSASLPLGASGSSPLSISLEAGPEPLSVAEQQYAAITSASGSSGGFPWIWLALAVVLVLVAVVGIVLVVRRPRQRGRPPVAWAPGGSPPPGPG